jgi:hypothetical protein
MAVSIKQLQHEIERTTNRQCLNALRSKLFTITPDYLLKVISKELTGTAKVMYLFIYDQAEKFTIIMDEQQFCFGN